MTETATSGAASKKVLRQPMAGQVADDLRRRILAGEIAEGTQLLQEQLAAEFGISKVPVREALYQLEAEGYVTQQFHRGAVVSGLSPSQLMELFERIFPNHSCAVVAQFNSVTLRQSDGRAVALRVDARGRQT